ncbi:TonB family protein [Laspinema sp. A4]|uniref:energy transducer TonB n=1 Tax=Laspinema sp. D2d TaxID=2953686 RepID=UPI0021BB9170|nr:TonB family protein [Laspinema sp. D2d]MCT7983502.1 TonB family protein [Laspinema sp. D2d]
MSVSTVSAKGREQQDKQIARFIKFSVMGSAVVHLAALAFVVPMINLKSEETEDPIEFIVLEESTPTPEELMPESETIASATPEAIAPPETLESATPEPIEEVTSEPETLESATPEPIQQLTPEAETLESATPEPLEEVMPEPEVLESATPEPTLEPEPLDGGQETLSAEVPEPIETPPSDIQAEPLPGQRPPEAIPDPAPMPPQEMSPLTNSSPLDPGHNSRITNSNNIPPGSTPTESVTPERLPQVPDVKIVTETQGLPSPVRYESPFNPGVIVSGESEDPWESNLDRLSEPSKETGGTPEENEGQFPEGEADSTPSETRDLENESELDGTIACRRCDPPPYPEIALANAWEGTVILIADIAPDGTVISLDIQHPSSYPILDNAAKEQVKTWIFDPSEGGQQGLVIPVLFAL